MDAITKLRETLAFHGFMEASMKLETPIIHAATVLALWNDYPRSMDQYATVIKGSSTPAETRLKRLDRFR